MAEESFNYLQLWNTSRRISSNVIDAVNQEDESLFEEIEDEYGSTPFGSFEDAVILVDTIKEVTDTDMGLLDTVHKWVYNQFKREDEPEPVLLESESDENDDESESEELTNLEAWNIARSAVTSLIDWVKNGSDEQTYEQLRNKHAFLPDDPVIARDFVHATADDVDGSSTFENHNELSRRLKPVVLGETSFEDVVEDPEPKETVDEAEPEPEPEPETELEPELESVDTKEEQDEPATSDAVPESELSIDEIDIGDDEAAEMAELLYKCFISHEITYGKIIEETYEELPPRDVALTKVMNTSNGSKEERFQEIKSWVDEWYGNPEKVQEMYESRQSPMGYNPR